MGDPGHLWNDRQQAGQALADRLPSWQGQGDASTVVAVPRGGVAVGVEVASRLRLPITTWSVRKIVLPNDPERAIGAVAPGDVEVWDDRINQGIALGQHQRQAMRNLAKRELERRQRVYHDATAQELQGRHLLLVDDGIATGLTVCAAIDSLRALEPASLTLAVPVVDRQIKAWLSGRVDHLVALTVVTGLRAVGLHYRQFEQLDDAAVLELLSNSRRQVWGNG